MIHKKGTIIKRILGNPKIGYPVGTEISLASDFNTKGISPLIFFNEQGVLVSNYNIKAWKFLVVKTIDIKTIYEQT